MKRVESRLVVAQEESSRASVADDLKKPDPTPEEARAAIERNTREYTGRTD